jgi:hypothetical protein
LINDFLVRVEIDGNLWASLELSMEFRLMRFSEKRREWLEKVMEDSQIFFTHITQSISILALLSTATLNDSSEPRVSLTFVAESSSIQTARNYALCISSINEMNWEFSASEARQLPRVTQNALGADFHLTIDVRRNEFSLRWRKSLPRGTSCFNFHRFHDQGQSSERDNVLDWPTPTSTPA